MVGNRPSRPFKWKLLFLAVLALAIGCCVVVYKSTKEKMTSLMSQNEALVRENSQLKSQLGNIKSAPATSITKTAPPKGTVNRVQGDLATLSIGSDVGVAVNNVLQVYRRVPMPEYLGTVTILAVTPTEAVGRLGGPKRSKIKVNDEVAAKMLTGSDQQ